MMLMQALLLKGYEAPVSGTIGGNGMLKGMIEKGYYSPIKLLDDLLDA